MRAIIQRVSRARVLADHQQIGSINKGLVVLLGVAKGDADEDLEYIVRKTDGLRIFEDDQGKMNLTLAEAGGAILVVSQFTLLGDARKGRRPEFTSAASPEIGNEFYERYIEKLRLLGHTVATGKFGAMMELEIVNDGPVTILLDSKKLF